MLGTAAVRAGRAAAIAGFVKVLLTGGGRILPGRRFALNQSRALRIENTARSTNVNRSGSTSRSGGNGGFFVAEEPAAPQTASSTPIAHSTGMDALLALQSSRIRCSAKKKAIGGAMRCSTRSRTIKADLLLGQVSEGPTQPADGADRPGARGKLPGLDGILDDIELWARVELAKFGRFPLV